MELLSMKKRSGVTLDTLFNAFRLMTKEGGDKVWINQYVYTLSNPVEEVWFVHAYSSDGNQEATAKFDKFDL